MSFVQAQVPAVHMKFSLPVPVGQPQLTVVQPFVTLPQALPSAALGHTAGAQHTLGFGVVLHACPTAQLHVRVPPQPLL